MRVAPVSRHKLSGRTLGRFPATRLAKKELRPYLKPIGVEGGNPVDDPVLGINEQSNEDLLENFNKTKLGAGGTVETHNPGDNGPSDVSDREKIGDRMTVKELSAETIRRSGEDVNFTHQKAAAREDVPTTTAAVRTKEGRRKVSRTKTVKPVEAPTWRLRSRKPRETGPRIG